MREMKRGDLMRSAGAVSMYPHVGGMYALEGQPLSISLDDVLLVLEVQNTFDEEKPLDTKARVLSTSGKTGWMWYSWLVHVDGTR